MPTSNSRGAVRPADELDERRCGQDVGEPGLRIDAVGEACPALEDLVERLGQIVPTGQLASSRI
jgi:hypothetical protein